MGDFGPEVVAFTSVSTQFQFIKRMAMVVRGNWPKVVLVIGGSHVSLNPARELLDIFNVLCVGEGEYPLLEMVDQMAAGKKPGSIPNLWINNQDGTVETNEPRPFLENLDSIPFPDREMWRSWVSAGGETGQVVLLGRGCPFECTYCSNHVLRRLASGRYVRFRAADSITRELDSLVTLYPDTRTVYLQAETVGVDQEWLLTLTKALLEFNGRRQTPLSFTCNYRIGSKGLTLEVFAALREANVTTLEIGLESGSERLRKEILKRNYSNEDFLNAVKLARTSGMRINVYNMIGFPTETHGEHMETVRINSLAQPDSSNTSIFFPYPGTELYERCRRDGLIGELDVDTTLERRKSMLDMPQFNREEVQRAYDWFEYRVFAGTRPLSFRLRKLIRNKIGRNLFLYRLFLFLLPIWHGLQATKGEQGR
jgi:radical SAM superfamily enzyme YgiQ (UPF0313 family)